MNSNLSKINVLDLNDSAFRLFAKDWFLLTAGPLDKFNTMTAAWGGFGEMWNKKVCYVVVRPQRFTYQFMEENESFTLSFFEKAYRSTLKLCGTKSGRDIDKMQGLDITPTEGISGSVYFKEAKLVLECKKIYYQDFDPANFIDKAIHNSYPDKDYHRMYIGKIVNCLKK